MSTPSHRSSSPSSTVAPALYLAAGVLLTVIAAVAYIVLRDDGDARSGLMLFLIPIISALLIAAKVEQGAGETREHLGEQDARLHTITAQTNGILTSRIREAVRDEMAARDSATAHELKSLLSPDDTPPL